MDGIIMAKQEKPEEKKDGSTVDVLDYDGRTPDDYVPEGYESQEDFLQEMREEYQADLEFDRINREQALDDKKFALGEQWDPIVLEQRKGLPCLVINNIPQFPSPLYTLVEVSTFEQNPFPLSMSNDGSITLEDSIS